MKKAVLYARVSSKEQERGGFSIPAQIDLLTEYATKNNIEIVKTFKESETAKKAGRTYYNQMISFIKKNPDVRIILAEKTDRIYRNFKDYVTLDEFDGLEVHLVKENMIISDNAPSHIKLMHGMKVLLAKNYIDNLSEEVQKGIKKKVELGYYPGRAPIGYKNVKVNGINIIEPDEKISHFIKLAFDLYASTTLSFKSLAKELTGRGFYINGNPCRKHNIENILGNPIYYGEFRHNGVLYKGAHQPLISKELFMAVQNKRKTVENPKTTKHQFIYSGLIRCAKCGCMLVGEIKKGKYIYYHCTGNKGGDCKKNYLREEIIDNAIIEVLRLITITSEDKSEILATVKELLGVKEQTETIEIDNIVNRIKVIKNRLSGLYTDKLDGKIDEEFYSSKYCEWKQELSDLEIKLSAINRTEDSFIENCNILLELSENLADTYVRANIKQKQNILKILCSNFFYDGENVVIELKSAFEKLFKSAPVVQTWGKMSKFELFARNLISLLRFPQTEVIYILELVKGLKCA